MLFDLLDSSVGKSFVALTADESVGSFEGSATTFSFAITVISILLLRSTCTFLLTASESSSVVGLLLLRSLSFSTFSSTGLASFRGVPFLVFFPLGLPEEEFAFGDDVLSFDAFLLVAPGELLPRASLSRGDCFFLLSADPSVSLFLELGLLSLCFLEETTELSFCLELLFGELLLRLKSPSP